MKAMTEFERFLCRVGEALDEANRVTASLEQLEASCTRMTANYDSVGHGGGGGDSKDGPMASLADRRAELLRATQVYGKALGETLGFLLDFGDSAPVGSHDMRSSLVLNLRYVQRLPWTKILEKMNSAGYQATTLRTVYNWHTEALRSGEEYWNKWRKHNADDDKPRKQKEDPEDHPEL